MEIQSLKDRNDISTLKTQMKAIKQEIFGTIYPVGGIYISMDGENPKNKFGFGTWELVKDRFLVGAGDKIPDVDMTGGSWNHLHTLNNGYVPMYIGSTFLYYVDKTGFTYSTNIKKEFGVAGGYYSETKPDNGRAVQLAGTTDTTETVPPYLSVYIWRRVA